MRFPILLFEALLNTGGQAMAMTLDFVLPRRPFPHLPQDLLGWHLRWNVWVIEKNRDLPSSVCALLPDLQIPGAGGHRPPALFGCKSELVPTPIKSQRALNANRDDCDRELGTVSREELLHAIPTHCLCFGAIEGCKAGRHIAIPVCKNHQDAIDVPPIVRVT